MQVPCQTRSPACASQPLYFREAHDADYGCVEDGLADLGHEWWFSATWPRTVGADTCLSRIHFTFALSSRLS